MIFNVATCLLIYALTFAFCVSGKFGRFSETYKRLINFDIFYLAGVLASFLPFLYALESASSARKIAFLSQQATESFFKYAPGAKALDLATPFFFTDAHSFLFCLAISAALLLFAFAKPRMSSVSQQG